ncbi:MAG: hypothetical protein WBG42_02930, partial [Cryomorphaceae bacterium]
MKEDWLEIELSSVCIKAEKVKRGEVIKSDKLKYLDIGGIDNLTNQIIDHKDLTSDVAPLRAQQIAKKGDVPFSTVRTYLKNIAQDNKEFTITTRNQNHEIKP